MKRLFVALFAVAFALSSTAGFAADKKDTTKQEEPKKKEKKGGC